MTVILRKLALVSTLFLMASNVYAGGNHSGETRKNPQTVASPSTIADEAAESANDRSTQGKLLNVLYVDGYEVSVKIVDAKDSIPDGGSHNILIKIKFGGQIKRNDIVTAEVLFPDKTRKTKTLLELGDWYLAGYNMGQKGQHRIFISFKSNKNGEEHRTELSYL